MSAAGSCPRCGFGNVPGRVSCVSCGLALSAAAPPSSPASSSAPRPPFPHGLRAAFLDRLEGTVVSLGPELPAPRRRSLARPLLFLVAIVLFPFLLGTALALRLMGWKGSGGGVLRDLLLLNLHRHLRPEQGDPSWDLRLRDASGDEYAARLIGRDVSGPPGPGDFVVLWGRMRRGTLAVEMGFNGRTGSWMYL